MNVARMQRVIADIKATLGPEKSADVAALLVAARQRCGEDGPRIAEALCNALITHSMGQPEPASAVESLVEMLRAGVQLFTFNDDAARTAKA